MKIFYLKRVEDESGVSGTGRIAQGAIFDNGKVALTWLSEHPSVTIYDSIGEVHPGHVPGTSRARPQGQDAAIRRSDL